MASYTVIGKNSEGSVVISTSVGSLDQDGNYLNEIDVVNAVRTLFAGTPGIEFVVARKYEQVITIV